MDFEIARPSLRVVLAGIVVAVVVRKVVALLLENLRLPPGPWGAPVFGFLPFMRAGGGAGASMPARLTALAARHAAARGLMSVRLGTQLLVCVNSAPLVRDMFRRVEFAGRPHTPLNNVVGRLGVIMSEGELWRRQRQFVLEKLRALGVTRTRSGECLLEQLIMREVEELMEILATTENEAVDPDMLLGRHVHNVILQIICSQRFLAGDPKFAKFYNTVADGMKLYGQVHIGEYLPIYLRLPGKREVLNKLEASHKEICQYQLDIVNDRKAHPSTGEPKDLLDYYLLEMANSKENGVNSDIFAGIDEDAQLVQVMNDLFSAGMETVKSTLLWSVAVLARPEGAPAARRARAEVAGLVGAGRRVTLQHTQQLVYCQATLLEILRFCNVVPLGTVHCATKDCEIEGYKIPAGNQVIALISALHKEESAWSEPHLFKPERFICEKGQLKRNDSFMPFGVGRRMCLGDLLAKTELSLFLFNILNNFTFSLPEGVSPPPLEGFMGATHTPHPYKILFRRLQSETKIRNIAGR